MILDIETCYSICHMRVHVTNRITSLVSKSFMHVAPQMWYTLSQDIKHAHSTNSFKNKIKRKLLG